MTILARRLSAASLALFSWTTDLPAQDCAGIFAKDQGDSSGQVARLTALSDEDQRPRLSFWLDDSRLEAFLTRKLISDPDFLEAPSSFGSEITLNIGATRNLKMGRRELTLLRLDIAIAAPALTAMDNLAQVARNDVRGIVLLDASGSAARFLDPLLSELRTAEGLDAFHEAQVAAVWMLPGGRMGYPRTLGFREALTRRPDASETLEDFDQALSLSVDEEDLPVLALLGGDVALPQHPVLLAAREIVIAQVTPELDPELAESAATLSKAHFIDFTADLADRIVEQMRISGAFRSGAEERNALETEASRQMLCRNAPYITAESDTGREWLKSAVQARRDGVLSVWTVLNPLILDLEEIP